MVLNDKEDHDKAFTCDRTVIENLWLGRDERTKGQKIRRFYFRPYTSNLICLDIDCKNNKDGLTEFYDYCKTIGKPKDMLPLILQDLPDSFPCYVKTPNSGFHLYFRYDGEVKGAHLPHTEGIDIISGRKNLTAAGSFKDGKPYTLHGDFKDIPNLPYFLKDIISPFMPKDKEQENIPSIKESKKESTNKASWDKITEWAQKDKPEEVAKGKNSRAYCLALHAKKHKYSYDETLNELHNDSTVNRLPDKEIETICKSAFKK
jgi:hypothetical protein